MDLLSSKTINCSAKYINKIKNKIFLDALSKSDAHWDGKQEFFNMALVAEVRLSSSAKDDQQYLSKSLFTYKRDN